jgi:hypothetical protein
MKAPVRSKNTGETPALQEIRAKVFALRATGGRPRAQEKYPSPSLISSNFLRLEEPAVGETDILVSGTGILPVILFN